MEYNFAQDLRSIREILGLTQMELAEKLGVEQITISRNESGKTEPSAKLLERVYEFAFEKKIEINRLKEMLWKENLKPDGEITDEQCRHCLAATNLGFQYVFLSDRAIKQVNLVERCYISENEKEYYKNRRSSESKLGEDKVKMARIRYRGQGHYIEEILK